MRLFSKLALAASLLFATAAQASPITYTFNGPTFTNVSGAFTTSDKITGYVSFDTSLLNAQGTGSILSQPGTNNVTWSFDDGHNHFSNLVNTGTYTIQMSFSNFNPTSWNIDTTRGVTANADIFILDGGRYESYYQGAFASSSTGFSAANIKRSNVPEPGSLALLGLGALGLSIARRRKA